jgi:hypothetical protein
MSEKTKKVSYANLLKEALSDYTDTPKNVDTVGPFLDPILSYKGDGEIPTHKDAASILERYYFEQEQDKGVTVSLDEEESVVNKDIVTVGKDKAALPEEPEEVKKSKDDIEDAMAMEAEEMDMEDEDEDEKEEMEEQIKPEEPAGMAGDEKELPPTKGKDGEGQVKPAQLEGDDSVESAVIEKLISEMEDEDMEDTEDMEDMSEQDEKDEEELDVDEKMSEEDEDEAEMEEEEAEEKEEEAEEKEEEMEEQATPSAMPGGPSPKHREGEDEEDKEEMYESFKIFKEQIEEDDTPDISSDEVVV